MQVPVLPIVQIDGGFPKIWGTFLGVPIIRIVLYRGLCWGPLFRETTIEGLRNVISLHESLGFYSFLA